uniref:Uncharacterized protein n=1 Tax=viral metagenome TaxID=1070528 RepID=A0A6M3LS85_9ZZZZ
MRKAICPITNKPFDCLRCEEIVDDEKCPYMLRDEQTERELKFLRKVIEREINEKIRSKVL